MKCHSELLRFATRCVSLVLLIVGTSSVVAAQRSQPPMVLDGSKLARVLRNAQQGNVDAQFAMGVAAFNGDGVTQNYEQAAGWLQKAADRGHPAAQTVLASMYGGGKGVRRDPSKAFMLLFRAAVQRFPPAEALVGVAYAEGVGVPQNDDEAVRWYRCAATHNYPSAYCLPGYMYSHGRVVPQDYSQAVRYWRKAAKSGDARAQNNLGRAYSHGHGVRQDRAEALRWFKLAAAQDLPEAEFNCATFYQNGYATEKNYSEALRWYMRAAEHRMPQAEYNIGAFYLNGYAVDKDEEEAYRWFAKAAEMDFPSHKYYAIAQRLPGPPRGIKGRHSPSCSAHRQMSRRKLLLKRNEPIAEPILSDQVNGMVPVGFYFLTQLHDDRTEELRFLPMLGAPQHSAQLSVAKDTLAAAQHVQQQSESLAAQMDFMAANEAAVCVLYHTKIAYLHKGPFFCLRRESAAQHRTHLGEHIVWITRQRNTRISSCIQHLGGA